MIPAFLALRGANNPIKVNNGYTHLPPTLPSNYTQLNIKGCLPPRSRHWPYAIWTRRALQIMRFRNDCATNEERGDKLAKSANRCCFFYWKQEVTDIMNHYTEWTKLFLRKHSFSTRHILFVSQITHFCAEQLIFWVCEIYNNAVHNLSKCGTKHTLHTQQTAYGWCSRSGAYSVTMLANVKVQ